MSDVRVEYTIWEKRPHQAASKLHAGSEPVVTRLEQKRLPEELNKILDQAAKAYRKERSHLSLRFRTGHTSEWLTFE